MKRTFKVIYIGSQDEENFTFNQTYIAMKSQDNLITVLCDNGLLIDMSQDQFLPEIQTQLLNLEAI